MALSKQTPNSGFFYYNPLEGASINIFHRNGRDRKVVLLNGIHPFSGLYDKEKGDKQAISPCGTLRVVMRGVQPTVYINGNLQDDERFSIVYPNARAKKKQFASY